MPLRILLGNIQLREEFNAELSGTSKIGLNRAPLERNEYSRRKDSVRVVRESVCIGTVIPMTQNQLPASESEAGIG